MSHLTQTRFSSTIAMSRSIRRPLAIAIAAVATLVGTGAICPQATFGQAVGNADTSRDSARRAAIAQARGQLEAAQAQLTAAQQRIMAAFEADPAMIAAKREVEEAGIALDKASAPAYEKLRNTQEYKDALREEQEASGRLAEEQARTNAMHGATTQPASPASGAGTASASGVSGPGARAGTAGASASGSSSGSASAAGSTAGTAGANAGATANGSTTAGGNARPGGGNAGAGGANSPLGNASGAPGTNDTTGSVTAAGGGSGGTGSPGTTGGGDDALNVPVPTDEQVIAAADKLDVVTKRRQMELNAAKSDQNTAQAFQRYETALDKARALRLEIRARMLNDPEYKAAQERLQQARAELVRASAATY